MPDGSQHYFRFPKPRTAASALRPGFHEVLVPGELEHRRELEKLAHAVAAQGVTLVPTRIYFKDGLAKLEFAVGRGKNVADKRQTMAKRDAEREMARAVKTRGRD
jgi:hypothetical protein